MSNITLPVRTTTYAIQPERVVFGRSPTISLYAVLSLFACQQSAIHMSSEYYIWACVHQSYTQYPEWKCVCVCVASLHTYNVGGKGAHNLTRVIFN